jgi:hypothetical protein
MSKLVDQLEEVVAALDAASIEHALIGGLAVAAHRVIRSTQDVDLLVDGSRADEADAVFRALGYGRLHRTEHLANYLREPADRLDVLYARQPIARRLLADARPVAASPVRVVNVEGIVGFKLQALANDPRRTRDLDDIRALLREHRATLDWDRIGAYFELFDQTPLFETLRRELA